MHMLEVKEGYKNMAYAENGYGSKKEKIIY